MYFYVDAIFTVQDRKPIRRDVQQGQRKNQTSAFYQETPSCYAEKFQGQWADVSSTTQKNNRKYFNQTGKSLGNPSLRVFGKFQSPSPLHRRKNCRGDSQLLQKLFGPRRESRHRSSEEQTLWKVLGRNTMDASRRMGESPGGTSLVHQKERSGIGGAHSVRALDSQDTSFDDLLRSFD